MVNDEYTTNKVKTPNIQKLLFGVLLMKYLNGTIRRKFG